VEFNEPTALSSLYLVSSANYEGFIGTFTSLNLPWTRIPLFFYALISLIYRVEAKLHTWQQIVVGVSIGCFNGALWWQLCVGQGNPFNINVMEWTTTHLLNENGILPWYFLAVPAIVGALVVGSVERRIAQWLKRTDAKSKID
jgi:hypothetical protein